MLVSQTRYVADHFNTSNATAWLITAVLLYGVWRLWSGMRPDSFQRRLRALRERRQSTVSFLQRQAAPARTGVLQISLLPLMLLSGALAMLLAQAQRPDDVSRPITWALFTAVGAWYGTRAWSHQRGVGPLRNWAFAGAVSGVSVSVLLWGFYLAVDAWWGRSVGRLSASLPVVLWWTSASGALGAFFGASRANRVYRLLSPSSASSQAANVDVDGNDLTINSTPRIRNRLCGAVVIACCASAMFHLSVAPYVFREVDYWVWDHRPSRRSLDDSIIVTMPLSDAASDPYGESFRVLQDLKQGFSLVPDSSNSMTTPNRVAASPRPIEQSGLEQEFAMFARPKYRKPHAARLPWPDNRGSDRRASLPTVRPTAMTADASEDEPEQRERFVQVLFHRPKSMQVEWDDTIGEYDSKKPLVVPGRNNFKVAGVYRLKLTNIPGRAGVVLYPSLEMSITRGTSAFLTYNAIPVEFTDEDFNQVLNGNAVIKVIYLPNPGFKGTILGGVATLVSTRLDPGVDPIVEADRRGSILAVVRIPVP